MRGNCDRKCVQELARKTIVRKMLCLSLMKIEMALSLLIKAYLSNIYFVNRILRIFVNNLAKKNSLSVKVYEKTKKKNKKRNKETLEQNVKLKLTFVGFHEKKKQTNKNYVAI